MVSTGMCFNVVLIPYNCSMVFLKYSTLVGVDLSICDLTISVFVIIPTNAPFPSTTGILEIPLLNITLDASLIVKSWLATTNFLVIKSLTVSAHSFDIMSNAVIIPTNLPLSTTG